MLIDPNRCWAVSLGNCTGPITAEHLVASIVWQGRRRGANRGEKASMRVAIETRTSHRETSRYPLGDFKARLLCERHNHGTREYDRAAGYLAAALRAQYDRLSGLRVSAHETVRKLSGVHLERALLKYAINISIAQGLSVGPLGGLDAEPGWPCPALVHFALGPTREPSNAGLWIVPTDFLLGQRFNPSYHTNATGYVHLIDFEFWGWRFLLNLRDEAMPTTSPPAGRLNSQIGDGGLHITIEWPKKVAARF